MKKSPFLLALALMSKYFLCSTDGAQVNINLAGFQEGTLSVPENQEEGQIQVDLTEQVNSAPVTVVCSTLEAGPGLTSVEFKNSSTAVGTTQVHVTFRIISAGRAVTIQCSGQSDGNNKQFTFSASNGNKGLLRVTKAPTLHICPDVVLLHKNFPKSTFQVQFSERIKDLPVVIKCSTVESAGDSSVLQLNFTETRVDVDAVTAQVPYEIVAVGNPVQVICRAQSTNVTVLPVSPSSTRTPLSSTQVSLAPASSSVNLTNVTATAVTSVLAATTSVTRKRRKRSVGLLSPNSNVLQYWYNNSAGPPVTFAMDVSPLRIVPPAGYIRAPSGSFSAVLVLDKPAENTVDITCSLEVVPSVTQPYNTSELCFTSPKDKVTFANSTVEIKLNNKDIQFQEDELFKTISLTLSGSPAENTASLVRVACCGQDTGLSLRYANESAVAFTWVELRKLQAVDWDGIASGEINTTLVSDIDLTCPCNLKENSCDVGCCCDEDCNDFENDSSTCIPGFFGGATSERPFEFSCQASWPDSRDWQPFLCVIINNSPVIGYFYNVTSPPLAQDATSFNTLAEKRKKEVFTFLESEERGAAISGGLYTAGSTIKTAANTEDVNYARATLGVLNLPQSVFNGLCLQSAAVRFLKDVSSRCVLELDESLCSSQSSWSALNYLMPNKLSRPACPLPPAVLAEGRLNDTVGGIPTISSTDVQYYCADITGYVSKASQQSQDSVSSSLFDSNTQEDKTPPRCEFDDGETLPPAPSFNKTTRICSNVVVKVEYEFNWRDRQIDAVHARVTLGDVEIPAIKTNPGLATSDNFINTVSQSFSVKFLHSPLNASSDSQTPFQRSGNPGYLRGRPVLARLQNDSGQVTAGKIQLWSPGPDSLCAGSSLTPVLFGADSFSGCLLRLSLDDISNCSLLRETVLTNQARLVQATHVGRSGNADLAVPDDWLPVIRESVSNTTGSFSEEGTCSGIPSGLLIEMLVTEAGKYSGQPQMEIVGTKISYQYTTWRLKCVSGYGVACSHGNTSITQVVPSPSAITSTAASPSVSLNVTNSSVAPAKQNFSSKENGTQTREYGSRFQYFMVTSSVVFVKVPAVKPERVKSTADQSGLCYRDVCKEELFFPLTEAFQGEPREKALALSLFLMFLALVTFAVTKPWG